MQVPGDLRFKMKVASYLVGICARELPEDRVDPKTHAEPWEGILDQDGSRRPLHARDVCTAIRAGELDAQFSVAVEAALTQTIADVQVVRPSYLLQKR